MAASCRPLACLAKLVQRFQSTALSSCWNSNSSKVRLPSQSPCHTAACRWNSTQTVTCGRQLPLPVPLPLPVRASECLQRLQQGSQMSGVLPRLFPRWSQLGMQSLGHQARPFASLACSRYPFGVNNQMGSSQLQKTQVAPHPIVLTSQPHRTVIRYSKITGKKRTVHAVIDRFYRLDNGLWVRRQAGSSKKLWKKSSRRRHRIKQHIFCNKSQSKMLDRMVSKYWKTRRHYVDDPFEQYQDRNFNGHTQWQGIQPYQKP